MSKHLANPKEEKKVKIVRKDTPSMNPNLSDNPGSTEYIKGGRRKKDGSREKSKSVTIGKDYGGDYRKTVRKSNKDGSTYGGKERSKKISDKRAERIMKRKDKKYTTISNYGTMKTPANDGHKTPVNDGHKTMANKNMAPNFYVMDPGSPAKKMDTPGPFSYKAQTTMNKLGMVDSGMNDGHSTPLDDAGHGGKTGHTHADPKPFKYESDGGGLEVVGMPIPDKGIKTFTGYKGKGEERKIGDVGQGVSARSLQNPDRPREIVRGEVIGNNPYKTGDPYGSGKQVKTVGKGVITRTQTKKEKEAMKKGKFTVT